MTIEATGTLDEPVETGASAIVLVKLGLVRILQKEFDICDELDKKKDEVKLQCPIQDGNLTVSTINECGFSFIQQNGLNALSL